MTDERFEARLTVGLRAYAESGVRPTDHYEVAESILANATRSRLTPWGRPPRWLVPVLLGLLVAALTAGTLFVGSQPSPDPTVELPVVEGPLPTDLPIETLVVEGPDSTADPDELGVNAAVGAGPCAAMVQRLATWGTSEDPLAPLPEPERTGSTANGDLLVTTMSDRGEVIVGRLDTSRVPPEPITSSVTNLPHFPGFPMHGQSRVVASPDGTAVAVEQGDLGSAGCGDPLVMPADGGIRRPFPVGSFELVTDLAWAPDGSALYGVRRPTIDGEGRPFADEMTDGVGRGPGTVLRWDTVSGVVSELGSPCPDCRIDGLLVSPDSERLAANHRDSESFVGSVVVLDPDGTWRTVAQDALVVGWADDGSLVLYGDGIEQVTLDGESLARWDSPCCHGTGYSALLSPDGTTLAGMTLSSDFLSWRVTLLDVRDGTTREVWEARDRSPSVRGAGLATIDPATSVSGYTRVVAWAPDGNAVVVLDQDPDSSEAAIRLVRTDGSGATPPVSIAVPDLSMTLGFPNVGPSVAWLAAP